MKQRNRILIVDDNPQNTDIVERILAEHYDLTSVYDGEQAVEAAAIIHPDIVLLDIMLPGIDGYEVCRRLKSSAQLRNIKIIMVSAKALIDEKLEGYEAGADDYITKPFDGDELLAKVRVYQRLKSAEELDALKSGLLTLLSHETRTPLTYVTGATQRLLSEDGITGEHRELVEMIASGATRISSLLDKALRYGDLTSGRCDFTFQKCELDGVVGAALGRVSGRSEKEEVSLLLQEVPTVEIMVDADHLTDALEVILDNAVRFSPPGGEVELDARVDEDEVTIAVTDKGPGIPPEEISHLSEGLSAASIMHHSGGHGLNLAIARCIVDAHHGDLCVYSEEGKGTTFAIHLPRAKEPMSTQPGGDDTSREEARAFICPQKT